MAQPFPSYVFGPANPDSPSPRGFAITPADGADLTDYVRAVTVGTAGVLAYHDWDGNARTTASLPAGTYAMLARRVLSTGTTAADLTGWV